jgi:hypothetical protein
MWYSVEALFRCDVQDESDDVLYDKRIFLINVNGNKSEASKKAKKLALSSENAYENFEGGDVSWHLVKVLEVQNLSEEELYDGVEVFSRLMWESEAQKILNNKTTVQKKNRPK